MDNKLIHVSDTDMLYKTSPEPRILTQSYPSTVDARIYAFWQFASTEGKPPLLMSASVEGTIGEKTVDFAIPSHVAICLHLANQAHIKASSLTLSEFLEKSTNSFHVRSDCIGYLYNFFEQMFLNIVFAYTALEAFSNQTIPDDYIYTRIRPDKRSTESYDKAQIERNIALDIKLSEILPEITGIKLTKGDSLWSEYAKLRAIRDRVIHVKAADLGITEPNAKSIWATLLEHKPTDFSLVAHRIIKHFPIKHDPSSSPVARGRDLWINSFPFNRRKDPPQD